MHRGPPGNDPVSQAVLAVVGRSRVPLISAFAGRRLEDPAVYFTLCALIYALCRHSITRVCGMPGMSSLRECAGQPVELRVSLHSGHMARPSCGRKGLPGRKGAGNRRPNFREALSFRVVHRSRRHITVISWQNWHPARTRPNSICLERSRSAEKPPQGGNPPRRQAQEMTLSSSASSLLFGRAPTNDRTGFPSMKSISVGSAITW